MIRDILVSRCQPVAFFFSKFLFRSRRYSLGFVVLQVGVLAGSRAPPSVQAVVCFTLPNFSRIDSSSLVDLSAFAGPAVISGKIRTKKRLTLLNTAFSTMKNWKRECFSRLIFSEISWSLAGVTRNSRLLSDINVLSTNFQKIHGRTFD